MIIRGILIKEESVSLLKSNLEATNGINMGRSDVNSQNVKVKYGQGTMVDKCGKKKHYKVQESKPTWL